MGLCQEWSAGVWVGVSTATGELEVQASAERFDRGVLRRRCEAMPEALVALVLLAATVDRQTKGTCVVTDRCCTHPQVTGLADLRLADEGRGARIAEDIPIPLPLAPEHIVQHVAVGAGRRIGGTLLQHSGSWL